MKRYSFILTLFLTVILSFLSPSVNAQQMGQQFIDENNIKLNLQFLASDELEGRETTTRGIKLAALYITTQLQKDGVKPFFENGSYLMPFKVDASTFKEDSKLIFTNDSTTDVFNYLEDFFPDRNLEGKITDALPVVFVGYGITAPEYNYDDYSNIDVKGKYVIAINGEPSSNDTAYFDGSKETKYSNARTKAEFAKNHGAAGFLGSLNNEIESRWNLIKRFFSRPSMSILDESNNDNNNFISAFLRSTALKKIFENQKFTYADLEAKAEKGEPLPEFELTGKLKSEILKNTDIRTANNIVAVIEGTDPVLKNEYVAIGAHYDHLGVIDGKIYNGADDDGSGTVTVMEVAKAFAKEHNNKRSILIVFHTGEEKGLLGSSYLTDHLGIIKDKKVVAQINIDMVGRESADSIYSIGSDKLSSEMKKIVEEANNESVKMALNYKYDDPNDPNRFYYRSDHYNYAKHGIPIVFFFDDMRTDYHKDTDEVDKINFNKLRKIATLVYTVAEKIANLNHRPVIDKPVE